MLQYFNGPIGEGQPALQEQWFSHHATLQDVTQYYLERCNVALTVSFQVHLALSWHPLQATLTRSSTTRLASSTTLGNVLNVTSEAVVFSPVWVVNTRGVSQRPVIHDDTPLVLRGSTGAWLYMKKCRAQLAYNLRRALQGQ